VPGKALVSIVVIGRHNCAMSCPLSRARPSPRPAPQVLGNVHIIQEINIAIVFFIRCAAAHPGGGCDVPRHPPPPCSAAALRAKPAPLVLAPGTGMVHATTRAPHRRPDLRTPNCSGLTLKTDDIAGAMRYKRELAYGMATILFTTSFLGFAFRALPLQPPEFATGGFAAERAERRLAGAS
jgi:hypothetical protein